MARGRGSSFPQSFHIVQSSNLSIGLYLEGGIYAFPGVDQNLPAIIPTKGSEDIHVTLKIYQKMLFDEGCCSTTNSAPTFSKRSSYLLAENTMGEGNTINATASYLLVIYMKLTITLPARKRCCNIKPTRDVYRAVVALCCTSSHQALHRVPKHPQQIERGYLIKWNNAEKASMAYNPLSRLR
jgi:hypothetical protein